MSRARALRRRDFPDTAAIDSAIDGVRGLVTHMELDQSGVLPSQDAADLQAAFSGGLATIAQRLAAKQPEGDAEAQRIAARALQMLARLAGSTAP